MLTTPSADRLIESSSQADSDELLSTGPVEKNFLMGLGKPTYNHICTWKDCIALTVCFIACAVAVAVVFVPKYAVHLGQTRQFIWVGLCLTIMAWCLMFPFKRLLLVSTTESEYSTLQSLDAILRSDPTAKLASFDVRLTIVFVLGLGPALSVWYKSLGDGRSYYVQPPTIAQFGMIGPPGTQNLGFGLSQFVNATLPWFKDPGFPNRVYGFNMHVISENATAMLDGPMPTYVESIQILLRPEQSVKMTGSVNKMPKSVKGSITLDI